MVMAESFFCRVPYGVGNLIFKYLSEEDIIALKFAYPFVFSQHKQINVRDNFSCSTENISDILKLHPNPHVVTKLDFNYCYWIASTEITNFVEKCVNLKELYVAHSTINNKELAKVLSENVNSISKLSLSITSIDSFWPSGFLHHGNQQMTRQSLLSLSHFGRCQKTLDQLESLELYMGQWPIVLTTLLGACRSLENLTLTLDVEETSWADEFQFLKKRNAGATSKQIIKSFSSIFQTAFVDLSEYCELKTFFLQPSIRDFFDNSYSRPKISFDQKMRKLIRLIVKITIINLRNFDSLWTSIPWLDSRKTKWTDEHCHYLDRLRLNRSVANHMGDNFDWSRLERIKVLSLHPKVISPYCGECSTNYFLQFLTCPMLEELSVCADFGKLTPDTPRLIGFDPTGRGCNFIRSDALRSLNCCNNILRKFLIRGVIILYISNGPSFLEKIITSCPKLEYLYIHDVTMSTNERNTMEGVKTFYNEVLKSLWVAIRSARRLRLLSLKLLFLDSKSFVGMIRSLAYCPSLVQLGLTSIDGIDTYQIKRSQNNDWTNEWDEAEFTALFVELVERLPKLVALYVVFPEFSNSLCVAATAALEAKFTPTRPCFCVQIIGGRSVFDAVRVVIKDPPKLPFAHHKDLVLDQPPSLGTVPVEFD